MLALVNVLAVIAIGISAWTANGLVELRSKVSALDVRIPGEYPPKWFQEQYNRERTETRQLLEKMSQQLIENRELIITSGVDKKK